MAVGREGRQREAKVEREGERRRRQRERMNGDGRSYNLEGALTCFPTKDIRAKDNVTPILLKQTLPARG